MTVGEVKIRELAKQFAGFFIVGLCRVCFVFEAAEVILFFVVMDEGPEKICFFIKRDTLVF